MKITLIDYHKGNITSVRRACKDAGADVVVSDQPAALEGADAIILPGVGAFTDAMTTLEELELTQAIKNRVSAGVPFLGICLGMHLIYEGGQEHMLGSNPTPGLGLIPGVVKKMPDKDESGKLYKIPHVGWNSVDAPDDAGFSHPVLQGVEAGEFFYFTHSYISPASDFTIGLTTHSVTFPSVVAKENVIGVQFHPEKSSVAGARVIENFIRFAER